tara:strand:- start:395 stop:1096 length:702 start_codon:yes stop_codon:yes gene_type:complete
MAESNETNLTKSDKQNLLTNINNLIAIGKESALAGLELAAGFNPAIASAIKTVSSPKVTELLTTVKEQGVNEAAGSAAEMLNTLQDKKNMFQRGLDEKLEGVVGIAADAANSAVLSSAPLPIQNAAKDTLSNNTNAAFKSTGAAANMAAAKMADNATAALNKKGAAYATKGGSGRQRIRKRSTIKRSTRKRSTIKRSTRKRQIRRRKNIKRRTIKRRARKRRTIKRRTRNTRK